MSAAKLEDASSPRFGKAHAEECYITKSSRDVTYFRKDSHNRMKAHLAWQIFHHVSLPALETFHATFRIACYPGKHRCEESNNRPTSVTPSNQDITSGNQVESKSQNLTSSRLSFQPRHILPKSADDRLLRLSPRPALAAQRTWCRRVGAMMLKSNFRRRRAMRRATAKRRCRPKVDALRGV